ncbi:hypothetical protein DFH08DRAFT_808049 [Mycena albidolilacea]|uniref:Novel STAND NTPase 1 domain-containing protein n=1 Tax=Mycena albidolilacea TaxID=1033008 RepID=A0AAD7ERQ1_9AGAR|nr:hypothetical protein DFH08DRAFT_808049 [Mycena albidolilacea]
MPTHPHKTPQIRLNNVVTGLSATLRTLELLSETFNIPFLVPISGTTRLLLTCVQTVKRNRNDCTQLMERTYELLNAIINPHINSDTGGELSPTVLRKIGNFTETLNKIHAFIEAQQDGNRIRKLFRQGELSRLIKDCRSGLQQGLEFFKAGFLLNLLETMHRLGDITNVQKEAELRHQEVLDLIASLSDAASSDNASSPKIFHGRETELSDILALFKQASPRIAILGAGGIGKTSLAKTILHHPEITAKFGQHRFFVTCDSASTQVEFAALIGAHLGLKAGKDLTRPVLEYFQSTGPNLLILDNLETLWDTMENRKEVEEFLALLAAEEYLGITMRGAERPSKVQWSRPFLAPLKPLGQDAARQTFIDIADDENDTEDIDKILHLTGNLPLAIDLLAHLVDSEGCVSVLSRWEIEKTALISQGYDSGSNLEMSISVSLSSPRIRLLPHSRDLLSLLSMLPNGLSDLDLSQTKLLFDDIWGCKAALLRTSLAYTDEQQRVKAMVTIREYMQKYHPPPVTLIRPLLHHFHDLLDFNQQYLGTQSNSRMVTRITSNFSNIQNVLKSGLQVGHPDLANCMYGACNLNSFSRQLGQGKIPLMNQILNLLPYLSDSHLKVYFITELFGSWQFYPIANPDALIVQGLKQFDQVQDTDLKLYMAHRKAPGKFYTVMAYYYQDRQAAINSCQSALSLAASTENKGRQSDALRRLAFINLKVGNASAGQALAQESQRMAKLSGDLFKEAVALRIGALCETALGNYKSSLSACSRATDLLGICGLSGGELDRAIMASQAEVHYYKSEYAEARYILTRIIQGTSMDRDPYNYAMALHNMADIDIQLFASKEEISTQINIAMSTFAAMGEIRHVASCKIVLANLLLREGDTVLAREMLDEILIEWWGKEAETVNLCLETLGGIHHWVFFVHSLKLKQNLEINKALKYLGDLFFFERDDDTAISLFTVALDGFTHMDIHRGRAECMLRLGEIYEGRGDVARSADLWHTARPLFQRSSQMKQLQSIDEKLAAINKSTPQKK